MIDFVVPPRPMLVIMKETFDDLRRLGVTPPLARAHLTA
jgi:hypothetical protein